MSAIEAGRLISRRIRGGEFGSMPVIGGLIIIAVVFQLLNDSFLTPGNLSNLTVQIAAKGTMAVGIVLVLLLGQIDLSIASVSGLGGAVLAVLAVKLGMPDVYAMLLVIMMGTLIGALHGVIFTKLGVPAFVVTLAGLIGWQGLMLLVLGPTGTVNFPFEGFTSSLTQTFFVPWMGWAIGGGVVALYAALVITGRVRRAAARLPVEGVGRTALRIGGIAVATVVTVAVLNAANGTPLALLIFIGFVIAFDLLLRKTRYGRSIYAIGGDIEAARRAGINVDAVRISVFAIASTMGAIGGIMLASRQLSAGQSSGTGDLLLLVIAAAVIGGTSLFGGRGSPYGALLGALVLGAIDSGMLLLSLGSSQRFMITAAVLLAAVIIDAAGRRGRAATGR